MRAHPSDAPSTRPTPATGQANAKASMGRGGGGGGRGLDRALSLPLLAAAGAFAAGVALLPLGRKAAAAYQRHRDKRHRRFILGAWRAREYGQPVRYLLAYLELPWSDSFFELGKPPEFNSLAWVEMANKQQAGEKRLLAPFHERLSTYLVVVDSGRHSGNHEIDVSGGASGGSREGIVHGEAALRYLGRKYGLLGRTAAEASRVDVLLCELAELQREILRLVYHPAFKTELDKFIAQTLPTRLRALEAWLLRERRNAQSGAATSSSSSDSGCSWAVGPGLTVADCVLYDVVDQARHLVHGILAAGGHRELQDFMYRFEALPAVARYLGSERCQTLPRYTARAHVH